MYHPYFKKAFLSALILFASFFVSLSINAQMRQVYLDDLEPSNKVWKISFYTPSEGFVAFDSWIGYTVDSGRTFIKRYITNNVNYNGYQNVNTLPGFWIEGVKAFDQNRVIAYGSYGLVPAILSSTDGGLTYTLVYHSQFNNLQLLTGIKDMIFPQNNTVGYAVDADRILKTTNQGLSWTVVRTDPARYFDYLEAVDNNNVFAMSVQPTTNRLVKTTNGGASWQTVVLPVLPGGKLTYAHFLTASIGWLCMYDNDYKFYTYKTVNGGSSWVLQNNPVITPFAGSKLKFFDENIGFALAGQNTVYKTFNSGVTWEPLARDNNYSYLNYSHNDLQCLSTTQLWAGGGHGFLEMSNNGGGTPLPKAYFLIDTVGAYNNNIVNLINYSRTSYQYKWFVNNLLVSTSYNASYNPNFFHPYDTIKLVVINGTNTDTLVRFQGLNLLPPLPVITSFNPTSGGTGATINIVGQNFTNTTIVKLGGTLPSSLIVNSPTSITAIVAGGSSGAVSCTTQYGTASLVGFTFLNQPPPIITSFTPAIATSGTSITINGNNFNPIANNNIVYFGAIKAVIISATPTQIVAQVPHGATHKSISVLNILNGLTGYSGKLFLSTFSGGSPITNSSFSQVLTVSDATPSYNSPSGYPLSDNIDIDGDGKIDIIASIYNGSKLAVLKNNSNIGLISFIKIGELLNLPYFTKGISDFKISDIDGDGKLDVIATRDSSNCFGDIAILRNVSTGVGDFSFATPIYINGVNVECGNGKISIADIDGDGKVDIIRNGFSILRNTSTIGNISFANKIDFAFTFRILITSDIDGDNKTDIIITTGVDSITSIFRNTSTIGNISFAPKVNFKSGEVRSNYIYTTDIDGDNKLDLIVTHDLRNTVSILRNTTVNNIINFATSVNYISGIGSAENGKKGDLADLNGNGKPDFSSESDFGFLNFYALENRSTIGNVFFAPSIAISDIRGTNHIFADYDGDGKPDICQIEPVQYQNSRVNLFKNNIPNTLANAGLDVTICAGTSSQIGTHNLAINTYSWSSSPAGFISNSGNPIVSPSVTTSYFLVVTNGSTVAKDTVVVTINPVILSTSVSISTTSVNFCPGGTSYFVANPINGGLNPYYQWQINGLNVGTNSSSFNQYGLMNNDQVRCILTSNGLCPSPQTAISNIITVNVTQTVVPTISITASSTNICPNTPVTFTANTTNAGANPFYQWRVGITNVGTNSNTLTLNTIYNYAEVTCTLTSNAICASPQILASNIIYMTVNSNILPSVSISSTSTNICSGGSTTFTANAINGGTSPSYQWQINGINVGVNANTFTSTTLSNNDQVKCILTSNATCVSQQIATSNILTVTVTPVSYPNISISSTATNICSGTLVTFSATPINGGTSPIYQWLVNDINVGTNSPIFSTNTLANNSQVKCIITSNIPCPINQSVISNIIIVTVNSSVNPTLTISTSSNIICAGASTTFTATPTNGGITPSYQWQVNGINVGTNSNTFTSNTLTNSAQIKCILTSNFTCATLQTGTSNTITMIVNSSTLMPVITINGTTTNICSGSPITFTATSTNGGTTPIYQWQVNGVNAGINSSNFTSNILNNNDQVKCILTSNAACASPQIVTSNVLNINVNPIVLPTISITSTATSICTGSSITFTAIGTNAGTTPTYQWQVDGVNVGTNSNSFTSSILNNNTQVKCILTSNAPCAVPQIVTSNIIVVAVNSAVTPSVTIVSSTTNICSGSSITFTATPTNGGTTPSYQWQVNGINAGTNSNTFTSSTLTNASTVKVIMTSSLACALPQTAASNAINITVNNTVIPTVTFTSSATSICNGASVTFTSTSTNVGTTPIYQWKKNAVNVGTNSATYTSNSFTNGDAVTLTLTSNAVCASNIPIASNPVIITVATEVPTISIAGNTTVVINNSTNVTSTPTFGGTLPTYQWQDSTNLHTWANISGASNAFLLYTPTVTGNKLRCLMTSNSNCASGVIVNSNVLTFNVTPSIVAPNPTGEYTLRYFPNPVHTILTIDSLQLSKEWESVKIITADGVEYRSLINFLVGKTKANINVEALVPGVYFLLLTRKQGVPVYLKFIKE
jgi:FG-GAP-like repeat